MPPSRVRPRAGNARSLGDRFQLAQALHRNERFAEAASIYHEILRADPRHADALHFLGLVALQTNQPERGVRLIEQAIALQPNYAEALGNLGIGYTELRRREDALACYDKALALKPDLAEVHDNRGNVLRDLRRYEAAVASHDRAIALRPDDAGAFSNRGNALADLRRYQDALSSYDRAVALQPGFVEASCNRARALQAMRRHAEALTAFDEVISRVPGYAEAHRGRGNVLRDMRRPQEALAAFSTAIGLAADSAPAHNDQGNALFDLRRYDEAVASYVRAVTLRPDFAEAHNNYGNALQELQRFDEAFACYVTALKINPEYAEAYYNRGNLLVTTQRMEPALADYDRAVALKPDHADAHRARGLTLATLRRYEEALASLGQAERLAPDTAWLAGDILFVRRRICDWTRDAADVAALEESIVAGRPVASPFTVAAVSGSPAVQRKAAEIFAGRLYPADVGLGDPPVRKDDGKIHLLYVSADFRDHPMMHLMAGLFEAHDKSRFELTGFSLGPDSGDDCQRRVMRAFDRFIDVRSMPDQQIASLARRLGVDIAIDITGFTTGFRTGLFRYRAAPVQAQYLGFPGTMGAAFFDYIIADATVIPPEHGPWYTEKICYLPDSYQVNDRNRLIDARAFTRGEQGLPDTGVVFCCFNNTYKITPAVFGSWMRIMRCVEGSVLWLFEDNAEAAANLRREAAGRHIAPERLVFAKRLPLAEHLARHRLADLFLDTLPYNAHTTASDALWAGLPVLTCLGDSFAGRVAASLLGAVGLPELVAATADAYEALAIELATCPERLAALRTKLAQARLTTPLFNTERFSRHIEAAYVAMHARACAGLVPDTIHIGHGADGLRDRATVRR